MSRTSHLVVALLAAAAIVAGCGGAGSSSSPSSSSRSDTSSPKVQAPADREPGAGGAAPAAGGARPGRVALARGRELDALVDAYAPVTTRASFLIAAETLRRDAIVDDAPSATIAERAGAVRLELRRSAAALATARRKVAAQPAVSPPARRLQALLLAGITARERSLVELKALLDADGSSTTTDERRATLRTTWRASWDASVRAARQATTTMQDARAAIGLDPGMEDSIR